MDKRTLRNFARMTVRVLKAHTEAIADKQMVNSFANSIRHGGRPNCVLIALDDFSELAGMNEEDMEKHGWVRKVKDE